VKHFGVAVVISACSEEGLESNIGFTTNHHDKGFRGFPLFAGNYWDLNLMDVAINSFQIFTFLLSILIPDQI
jgi:hypothetical protein